MVQVVGCLSQGCVWLTRRLLWVLMMLGNAISCFLLRQMEFDADRYEARVAGSAAFESTALKLQGLGLAARVPSMTWESSPLRHAFPTTSRSWFKRTTGPSRRLL